MKDYLKYITWIVLAVVALIIVFRVTGLFKNEQPEEVTVTTPSDSAFLPIHKREFKPSSIPFEKRTKPPVRLPKGIKEKDVARAIIITKSGRGRTSGDLGAIRDTIRLLELKNGSIFVEGIEGIETKVEEITYVPPILSWGLFTSSGISIGRSEEKFLFSPMLAVSPLQISGVVQFPLLIADLNGVGIGAGYRYDKFVFGITSHWQFENKQQGIRLFIAYSIN